MLNSREKRLLKKKKSRRNELNYIVLFGIFGDRIYKLTGIIYFYIGESGKGAEGSVFSSSSCSIIQHEHIYSAKKFK